MKDKYQALRDAVKEADDDYGLRLYRDETAQLVELLAERDALALWMLAWAGVYANETPNARVQPPTEGAQRP